MAATEDDILRDEQERSSLLRTMADIERAIVNSPPGSHRILETTLDSVQKRVATLDKKIAEAKAQHEAEQKAATAAANLVVKETALNARERETYGGFLKEEFFTKKDFGKLAEFYAHTWDRLSESGKDEMSRRVWEGVRREEYRFSELPDVVREKEAARVYKRLRASSIGAEAESRIPARDRQDFMDAYEAGRSKEAEKILDRPSFRENLFLKTDFKAHRHAVAGLKRENESKALVENSEQNLPKEQRKDLGDSGSLDKADFSSIKLDGMMAASLPAAISSASIPNGKKEAAPRQVS